ncbi:hypothetical protein CLV46_0077 [Diaminobutyricimonas aerilata]|uniref:Pyrroloquinoline-quinone binding quinoprotein n=1 Tax=Diaminobutyricimonas aerilata TaxID=1162967 RepID=A0A2M9CFD0_9MICO|nr:zinc metallochaperone AztD [Diaminobutyricimonas aerilata]PJJ70555.1 hypothetical protein CLV46_0077 [Diaminobutyricimonas aerilata]
MRHSRTATTAAAAFAAVVGLTLAGCAATDDANEPAADSSTTTPSPQIALTYDGGLLVLDAETLEVAGDLPIEGFTRVNPSGNDRHIMVTTTEGFRVLDTGAGIDEPELTDLVFEASEAGHVVRHADRTVLFADGTGDITLFDTADLNSDELPETETVESEAAHHGVAIELEDGTLLSTIGTPDSRTGARVLDPSGAEIARNEDCPAVHGEGTAADEVVVFGCENGVLVYTDGAFTKIPAPDAYGRMGNAYVTETSPIAVGDYNSDPDSEGYLLSELTLIDTVALTSTVVDLPEGVEYTWRGVSRGPQDEIVLLSADGTLNLLDETTGEVTESWSVIDPWESPVEWQDAHPALTVHDGIAYVTEPAADRILAVDLATGETVAEGDLPATPNEIAITG